MQFLFDSPLKEDLIMKKAFCFLLALAVFAAATLGGCSGNAENGDNTDNTESTESTEGSLIADGTSFVSAPPTKPEPPTPPDPSLSMGIVLLCLESISDPNTIFVEILQPGMQMYPSSSSAGESGYIQLNAKHGETRTLQLYERTANTNDEWTLLKELSFEVAFMMSGFILSADIEKDPTKEYRAELH